MSSIEQVEVGTFDTAALQNMVDAIQSAGKGNVAEKLAVVAPTLETMKGYAEPYVVAALPKLVELTGLKSKDEAAVAEEALRAAIDACSPSATKLILPALFVGMEREKGWQQRVVCLSILEDLAKVNTEELSPCLPMLVPVVTAQLFDTKKQVKEAGRKALVACMTAVDNADVKPVVSELVDAMVKPALVPEFIHRLGAVVFVRSVTAATLAIMVPTLVRALADRVTAVKRQTSVIITNMSKLVDAPLDAAAFLPLLLPALGKASDSVSNPEARNIVTRAFERLNDLQVACDLQASQQTSVDPAVMKAALIADLGAPSAAVADYFDQAVDFVVGLAGALIDAKNLEAADWRQVLSVYLTPFVAADTVTTAVDKLSTKVNELLAVPDDDDDEDDAEELCNCKFTLAYGTKILLHNTKMKLKRGKRYGLLGGNDCGKTTLMRSIANGSVEGFPDPATVKTVFVEADIQGEQSHLSCVDYVLHDARIKASGISGEEVARVLQTVHFTEKMCYDGVSTLSGGWRMKLAMARAMLQNADILLLDEPTNHLDVINVAWVKNYLNSLDQVTSIIVSHDSGLLDDVCTHILQIDNLRLNMSKGNLSEFVKKVPKARSYFELKATTQKFTFPQPGPLEGVKSKGKALMKMVGVTFTYPGNEKPTVSDVSVQVSLSSRVACVGVNGAGKSTMIKLLTGELEPNKGTGSVWKHPNARVAYVAQHAFHHIEKHLEKTPNQYIQWRYANEEDKETLTKVTMVVTEEEAAKQKESFEWVIKDEITGKTTKQKRSIEKLAGARRTTRDKSFEYEVKFRNMDIVSNDFVGAKRLAAMGFSKAMKEVDNKVAARAGMYIRPLTSSNIEKHLEDVGLDREFGTHSRMGALSGGQKVKVVIAAAMWNQPHILILDEPTNYLDRDALGALAGAIETFEGGVVMITHNNEFCSALCPETWVLENGTLNCKGDAEWMSKAAEGAVNHTVIEEMVDGSGNTVKLDAPKKKEMSRREKKMMVRRIAQKKKAGEELSFSENEFEEEQLLAKVN